MKIPVHFEKFCLDDGFGLTARVIVNIVLSVGPSYVRIRTKYPLFLILLFIVVAQLKNLKKVKISVHNLKIFWLDGGFGLTARHISNIVSAVGAFHCRIGPKYSLFLILPFIVVVQLKNLKKVKVSVHNFKIFVWTTVSP